MLLNGDWWFQLDPTFIPGRGINEHPASRGKAKTASGASVSLSGEPAGDISGRKRSFQAGFHKLLHASSGLCFLCTSSQTCMILLIGIDHERHLRKRKVIVGGGGPGPQDNPTGPPKPTLLYPTSTLLPIPGLLSCG